MGDRTVHADPLTGQRFRTLKTGDETGGQLLQTELWLASGGYIPAHVHPQQDERFELLSGQLRFTIGDQERVADVGDVIVVPAGTPQRASNESAEEAHLLIEVRPALDLQQALEQRRQGAGFENTITGSAWTRRYEGARATTQPVPACRAGTRIP